MEYDIDYLRTWVQGEVTPKHMEVVAASDALRFERQRQLWCQQWQQQLTVTCVLCVTKVGMAAGAADETIPNQKAWESSSPTTLAEGKWEVM